jgi:hypothetical protein
MTGMLRTTPEVEPPAFLLAQIEAATVNRTGFLTRVKRAFDYVPTTARWASAPVAAAIVLLGILLSNNGNAPIPVPFNNVTQRVEQAVPGLPHAIVEEQIPAAPTDAVRPKAKATGWKFHGRKPVSGMVAANQPKKSPADDGSISNVDRELAVTEEPKLEQPVVESPVVASKDVTEPETEPVPTAVGKLEPVAVVKASNEKPAKKAVALDEPGAMEQLRSKLASKNKSKLNNHEDRIEGKKYSVGLISLRF